MADAYYLTNKDRYLLNKLHVIFSGHVTPNRHYSPEEFVPKGPDVYIALVPEEGIPAATDNAGTGVPSFIAGDKPGSLDCDIYRIINGELKLAGPTQTVYNLTSSDIEEGWIAVQRDKFGNWLADVGGGSCPTRNEKWMIQLVGATSDDFDISLTINGVTETITIAYNATAAQVKTAFETHSELVSTDLETEGGPLPNTSVNVEFVGTQAGKSIIPISITNNLGGTGAKPEIYRWIPGFPD